MPVPESIPVEQIEAIIEAILQEHLKKHLKTAIEDFIRENEQKAKEISLLERIIRVEEELKALKEIELARFEAIEKRFEAVDKRFEALQREMNARFEALIREMDARFQAIEKRLSFMQWFMGIGFTIISILIALLKFF